MPDTLTVAPPENVTAAPSVTRTPSPSAVASAVKTSRAGGAGARAADIGGGDDGDEPVFSLIKGDGSGEGSGTGRGAGRGNDLDRGRSAAYSNAQVIESPAFHVPYQFALKHPDRSIKLNVTVLANGQTSDIEIVQSCGIPELDEAYRAFVASYKFRPAFDHGKAVTSVMEIGLDF